MAALISHIDDETDFFALGNVTQYFKSNERASLYNCSPKSLPYEGQQDIFLYFSESRKLRLRDSRP